MSGNEIQDVKMNGKHTTYWEENECIYNSGGEISCKAVVWKSK